VRSAWKGSLTAWRLRCLSSFASFRVKFINIVHNICCYSAQLRSKCPILSLYRANTSQISVNPFSSLLGLHYNKSLLFLKNENRSLLLLLGQIIRLDRLTRIAPSLVHVYLFNL